MRHASEAEIAAYIDGECGAEMLTTVQRHLGQCAECRSVEHEIRQIVASLSDPDTWAFGDSLIARDEVETLTLHPPDSDPEGAIKDIVEALVLGGEITSLDYVVAEAVSRELTRRAGDLLDTSANDATRLLDIATVVTASHAHRPEIMDARGQIEKQRANALRMLGRYPEALDALESAERHARSFSGGGFLLAQIRYTRATVLFKMGNYLEATVASNDAASRFAEYGATRRLMHARLLEAGIVFDEGNFSRAQVIWRDLLLIARELDDVTTVARLHGNIAACAFRLGDYDEARREALDAQNRYRTLGMNSEVLRSEWILGAVELAEGSADAGLIRLRRTAVSYDALGMDADASFVRLFIIEELLRRESWEAAEKLARSVAQVFARASANVHLISALAFLREAVESRRATPSLVSYVRDFVAAEHPTKSFEPPETQAG